MSIAAPPEASRSIKHFRCKKDFFYKHDPWPMTNRNQWEIISKQAIYQSDERKMDKRNWSNDFYLDIFSSHFENLLNTIRKPWIGKENDPKVHDVFALEAVSRCNIRILHSP